MGCRDKGKNKSRHHTHAKKPSGAITPRSEYTTPEAKAAAAPAAEGGSAVAPAK